MQVGTRVFILRFWVNSVAMIAVHRICGIDLARLLAHPYDDSVFAHGWVASGCPCQLGSHVLDSATVPVPRQGMGLSEGQVAFFKPHPLQRHLPPLHCESLTHLAGTGSASVPVPVPVSERGSSRHALW